MRPILLVVSILLASCAGNRQVWTPTSRVSAVSCRAPGDSGAVPWRLVSTPTLTFCVPPSWRTRDGRTWEGDGGTITLGFGSPPPRRMIQGTVVVQVPVPSGGGMPSQEAIAAAAAAQGVALPDCHSDRRNERIGGQFAALYDTECNGKHRTGAQFDAAGVYLQGEADFSTTAFLQLAVYRTIRFVGQTAP